jgi:hypothetical protein
MTTSRLIVALYSKAGTWVHIIRNHKKIKNYCILEIVI